MTEGRVAAALRAWREAQRRLEATDPASPEWAPALAAMIDARGRYVAAVQSVTDGLDRAEVPRRDASGGDG